MKSREIGIIKTSRQPGNQHTLLECMDAYRDLLVRCEAEHLGIWGAWIMISTTKVHCTLVVDGNKQTLPSEIDLEIQEPEKASEEGKRLRWTSDLRLRTE